MDRNPKKQIAAESINGATADDILKRLFAPDVTAMAAYQLPCRQQARLAETELMAAVSDNGIAGYRRFSGTQHRKRARRFADAETWIGYGDSQWVFSFDNCCAALGIDAGYSRNGLLAWRCAQRASTNASLRPRSRNIFRKAA